MLSILHSATPKYTTLLEVHIVVYAPSGELRHVCIHLGIPHTTIYTLINLWQVRYAVNCRVTIDLPCSFYEYCRLALISNGSNSTFLTTKLLKLFLTWTSIYIFVCWALWLWCWWRSCWPHLIKISKCHHRTGRTRNIRF